MNVEQTLGVFESALMACEQDGRSRVVRDGLDHEVWAASDMDGIRLLVGKEEVFPWRELNAALEGQIVNIGERAWFEIRAPSLARPERLGFAELISTALPTTGNPRVRGASFGRMGRFLLESERRCRCMLSVVYTESCLCLSTFSASNRCRWTTGLPDCIRILSSTFRASYRSRPPCAKTCRPYSEFEQLQCRRITICTSFLSRSGTETEPRGSHFGPAQSSAAHGTEELQWPALVAGLPDEDAPLYAKDRCCILRSLTIEPDLGLLSPSRLEAGTVYEGVSWRLRKSSSEGFYHWDRLSRCWKMW